MNKDIELVESALSSFQSAQQKRQELLLQTKIAIQERFLKEVLVNIPEVTYYNTPTDFQACVSDINFSFEVNLDSQYGRFVIKYKTLIKFLRWGWVMNNQCLYGVCRTGNNTWDGFNILDHYDHGILQQILNSHLKALQWGIQNS